MASPAVVSASRRTDIPAFHADWFARSLARGEAAFRHPYSGRPAVVSLRREDVAAFVFWTRQPRPFLPVVERLEREGVPSVFHVTITGMPRDLEPAAPPAGEAVRSLRELSGIVGPGRVFWRFDPLLPGEDPGPLVARFERLAEALSGHASLCTLSIAHPYRKSLRATRDRPGIWRAREDLPDAAARIAGIGRARGFAMRSCCTPALGRAGIPAGACVDAGRLSALFPGADIAAAPSPVREGCRCAASRDIGSYRTCGHGCLYCYAA